MARKYRHIVPFITRQDVAPGMTRRGSLPHHLFSITLEGGATYEFPGGRVDIRKGDLLRLEPDTREAWTAHESDGWSVYYLIIDLPARLLGLLPPANLAPGVGRIQLDADVRDEVVNAFVRMDRWGDSASGLTGQLLLNQLEYIFLLVRDAHPIVRQDPRVEKARDFLQGRLEIPTTLDDVARAAFLSKARLCALFKDAIGVPPLQYLEQLRMERAVQLLLFTSLDVDRIADTLTYQDRKYFDKRFKRHWQVTPYRYRRAGGLS